MQVTMKAIMWGAVGTIATTVLGKIVESVFDVSFIGPAFLALWNWVKAVGSWLGRDAAVPVWLVLLLCLLSAWLLGVGGLRVYVKYFEKGREPEAAPLTADQQMAFVVIGLAAQRGETIGFDQIREDSRLSRIAAQNALDHLYSVGLINPARSFGSIYPELTPLGRDYYLELERENGWTAHIHPSRIL